MKIKVDSGTQRNISISVSVISYFYSQAFVRESQALETVHKCFLHRLVYIFTQKCSRSLTGVMVELLSFL